MKTLLLILFASVSAFSQIPLSGEREESKFERKELDKTFLLPNNQFQLPSERVNKSESDTLTRFRNLQMPIYKTTTEQAPMPILGLQSFDQMNADSYFKQKRTTIADDAKTSKYRHEIRLSKPAIKD